MWARETAAQGSVQAYGNGSGVPALGAVRPQPRAQGDLNYKA